MWRQPGRCGGSSSQVITHGPGRVCPADYNQCIWATRLLYVLGLCFIKLSLLWFYLRLETRRFMLWLVYSVIFIVLGVSISSFFVDTISCIPPSKFWNSAKSGHCMSTASQQKFYEVNGILVIVMDILIWAVPIPMLWRVRISLVSTKILFPTLLLPTDHHLAAKEDCSIGSF